MWEIAWRRRAFKALQRFNTCMQVNYKISTQYTENFTECKHAEKLYLNRNCKQKQIWTFHLFRIFIFREKKVSHLGKTLTHLAMNIFINFVWTVWKYGNVSRSRAITSALRSWALQLCTLRFVLSVLCCSAGCRVYCKLRAVYCVLCFIIMCVSHTFCKLAINIANTWCGTF